MTYILPGFMSVYSVSTIDIAGNRFLLFVNCDFSYSLEHYSVVCEL